MSMVRLYLFRHFLAHEGGEKLAQKVAAELARRRVQLIVGSDLRGSVETMEMVARLLRVPWYATERLRSWNVGPEFEGRDRDEVEPELKFFRENPHLKPPGGQSFGNFCATRMEAIHELITTAAAPRYPRIAAQMHGSVMKLVRPLVGGRTSEPQRIEAPEAPNIVTLTITSTGDQNLSLEPVSAGRGSR